MGRRFPERARAALWLASDGACTACGVPLDAGWHADHVVPFAHGGATDVANGQALCPTCNLSKGARVDGAVAMVEDGAELRQWQRDALDKYRRDARRTWLLEATPGAGKTRWALTVAKQLLADGVVSRVVVVVPTDHLRTQWAGDAAQVGVQLDPELTSSVALNRIFVGAVTTYQAVAMNALYFRRLATQVPTLVICDEIHHAADTEEHTGWGPQLRHAFERATRLIALSGTPFRSDARAIPFVDYDDQGVSQAQFRYGYDAALRDGVCRSVTFPHYEGDVRYWDRGGVECQRRFAEAQTEEQVRDVLRAVLDPSQAYLRTVLTDAHRHLMQVRHEVSTAGGLIVARDTTHAGIIAALLRDPDVAGVEAAVAHSREDDASGVIRRFRDGDAPWLVSVRMVSEGVDIRRLVVGVFATNVLSELFFRQFVGRFVRTLSEDDAMVAHIFMPSAPPLLQYAADIKRERDHVLGRVEDEPVTPGADDLGTRDGAAQVSLFHVASATATHSGDIHEGEQFSAEELRLADQFRIRAGLGAGVPLARLVRAIRELSLPSRPVGSGTQAACVPAFDERRTLRRHAEQLCRQVAMIAKRHTGRDMHRDVRARLAQATGAWVEQSSLEQLRNRITLCQQWLQEGTSWT